MNELLEELRRLSAKVEGLELIINRHFSPAGAGSVEDQAAAVVAAIKSGDKRRIRAAKKAVGGMRNDSGNNRWRVK